jgi:pimeloyl-ACP methyl ester carboxylesterase/DNA-binding CsgD family transcriptional regulator
MTAVTLRQSIRFATAADGVRIAYATSGSGPPLVKIGTWMSHLEFDLGSPVWGHLLNWLSQRFTLLRYDQRGNGLSDWNVADLSFEAWVRDLATVIDASGQDRVALLGLSQGAPVAIAYAVRHPERVSHLILHGGYARGRRRRGADAAPEQLDAAVIQLIEHGWGGDDASFRQFFTSQFVPDGTPEQHRWFNELERVSASPGNAARLLRTMYDIDVIADLAAVACPTLVLHASGDLRVPFGEGRLLAGAITHARFVPLDSRNHLMLAHEAAWRRWTEEVAQFMQVREELPTVDPARLAALTPRERELLELIAQGRDNAQIGALLALSDKTVRNHITSIFAKLEVENRPQAIVLARSAGLGKA